MRIPIDMDVCEGMKCEKFIPYRCMLEDCPALKHEKIEGCPVPENCKYKNIHVTNGKTKKRKYITPDCENICWNKKDE